jgi:hypothetical protein
MTNEGLCRRCTDKIEWRKKYRKYKPLTKPAVCVYCKKKEVKAAYHKSCLPCAQDKGLCPFCLLTWGEIEAADAETAASLKDAAAAAAATGANKNKHRASAGAAGAAAVVGSLVPGGLVVEDEDDVDDDESTVEEDESDEEYDEEGGGGDYMSECRHEAEAQANKQAKKLALNGGVDWSKFSKRGRRVLRVGGGGAGAGSGSGVCLEVQAPFGHALLSGLKTVETRRYPLPPQLLGIPLSIMETTYSSSAKGGDDGQQQQQPPSSASSETASSAAPSTPPTSVVVAAAAQPQQSLPSFVPEGSSRSGGLRTNWEGWKFGDARTLPAMELYHTHAVCFGRLVSEGVSE